MHQRIIALGVFNMYKETVPSVQHDEEDGDVIIPLPLLHDQGTRQAGEWSSSAVAESIGVSNSQRARE